MMRHMRYTMADLVEQSGISARTIRSYIALRLIPRPEGKGPAALYTPRHMRLCIAVSRMRAQGISLAVCYEEMMSWTDMRLRRYLKESEPKTEARSEPPASPEPPPSLPPELEAPTLPGARGKKLQKPTPAGTLALPDAPAFKFIPILPNLILCVGERATPLVQRVAAEIYEKYGGSRTDEE